MIACNDAHPADQGSMSADSILLLRYVNNLYCKITTYCTP